MISEDELSKLAESALLQEAKRGAMRAEMVGPSGWLKPRLPSTNKKFLQNTLKGAVASNQVKDRKRREARKTKLDLFEEELKERKRYKKLYIKASTKKDEKPTPKVKKIVKEIDEDETKSVNGVAWNDDDEGLNISCSISASKKKYKKSSPSTATQILTRNISFVSNGKDDKLGVT